MSAWLILSASEAAAKHEDFMIGENNLQLACTLQIPDGHKIGKAYLETSANLPISDVSEKYQGKALVIHGTRDELVPYAYGVKYYEMYDNGQINLLKKASHNFVAREAEVANLTAQYISETVR